MGASVYFEGREEIGSKKGHSNHWEGNVLARTWELRRERTPDPDSQHSAGLGKKKYLFLFILSLRKN